MEYTIVFRYLVDQKLVLVLAMMYMRLKGEMAGWLQRIF